MPALHATQTVGPLRCSFRVRCLNSQDGILGVTVGLRIEGFSGARAAAATGRSRLSNTLVNVAFWGPAQLLLVALLGLFIVEPQACFRGRSKCHVTADSER